MVHPKILFYQKEKGHTEIAGYFIYFLQTLFGDMCNNIFVYHPLGQHHPFNSFVYYKSLFNLTINYVKEEQLNNEIFDIVIFLTSREVISFKYKPSIVILVNHIAEDFEMYKNRSYEPYKHITVSPFIEDIICPYILPIYNYDYEQKGKSKVLYADKFNSKCICIVGLNKFNYHNRNIEQIIELVNKLPPTYIVKLFADIDTLDVQYMDNIANRCSKSLEIITYSPTLSLIQTLQKSMFIFTADDGTNWYHQKTLTGMIPLALNNDTPLIQSRALCDIYFSHDDDCDVGLIYNKNNIDGLINKLNELTEYEYTNFIFNLKREKDKFLKKNDIIMKHNILQLT